MGLVRETIPMTGVRDQQAGRPDSVGDGPERERLGGWRLLAPPEVHRLLTACAKRGFFRGKETS